MMFPTDAATITCRKFFWMSADGCRAAVTPPAAALMRLSWDRCVLWIVDLLSRPLKSTPLADAAARFDTGYLKNGGHGQPSPDRGHRCTIGWARQRLPLGGGTCRAPLPSGFRSAGAAWRGPARPT